MTLATIKAQGNNRANGKEDEMSYQVVLPVKQAMEHKIRSRITSKGDN